MITFVQYFIERSLVEPDEVLSESATISEDSLSKSEITKLAREKLFGNFAEKFPDVQCEDMEEAFRNAVNKTFKKKPKSKKSAEKVFAKAMEEELSEVGSKKRIIGKNLSCIKRIKSATEESISSITKRAEKILTAKEKRVIEMCSKGKSVRFIAQEMDISHPTAWRILNSAVDKIRMSHGMRPRHKDIRKK